MLWGGGGGGGPRRPPPPPPPPPTSLSRWSVARRAAVYELGADIPFAAYADWSTGTALAELIWGWYTWAVLAAVALRPGCVVVGSCGFVPGVTPDADRRRGWVARTGEAGSLP
jgi:hypothetical protein